MRTIFYGKQPNRKRWRSALGFTTVEVLVTVAIVAVLASVAAVGISGLYKSTRQKELDSKAQIIFTAAQNRLTKLAASGLESVYSGDGTVKFSEGSKEISAIVNGSGVSDKFLPADSIGDELKSHQWVVEFDAGSVAVTAVYYSESESDMGYGTSARSALVAEALSKCGKIGYYKGDITADSSACEVDTLRPCINIENGEVLKATVTCPEPKVSGVGVSFKIRVYDKGGNESSYPVETVSPVYDPVDRIYSCELVLDALTGNLRDRFSNRFPSCTAGGDIVVSIEAVPTGEGSSSVDGCRVTAVTNSLFDRIETDGNGKITAVVTCGRHLQNLDSETVEISVSAVRQNSDIDWGTAYPSLAFIPIENPDIESYCGAISGLQSAVIYNLTVDTSASGASAGLFEKFSGTDFDSLCLCGAEIKGGNGSAGTLAGIYSGSGLNVSNCRVYLDEAVLQADGASSEDAFITGSVAGGFVGSSGGLLSISESYSDCYLKGGNAAGFVGLGNAGTVSESYTAGFVTSSVSGAGMVNGNVGNIKNSYTVVRFTPDCNGSTYAAVKSAGTVSALYFHPNGSTVNTVGTKITYEGRTGLLSSLGSPFAAVSSLYSVEYCLGGKEIPTYEYPILSGVPQYGDWEVHVCRADWLFDSRISDDRVLNLDILKMDGNSVSINLGCSEDAVAGGKISSDNESVAKVTSVGEAKNLNSDGSAKEDTHREVTLDILSAGSANIKADVGEASDTFKVNVSAVLTASSDKSSVTLKKDKTESIVLKAAGDGGADYTNRADLNWNFTYSNGAERKAEIVRSGSSYAVKGLAAGTEIITVTASITKNGRVYTSNSVKITVTVESTVYTVIYHGQDGGNLYTVNSETPLTAEAGTAYTGYVTFAKLKEPTAIAVYVNSIVLDGGYTLSGSGTSYTVTVNAASVTGNIDIYIYGESSREQVSVTFSNQYLGILITYLTDANGYGSSSLFSGANRYATPGMDYLAYLTGVLKNVSNITVKCNGKTLKKDLDYSYTADSNGRYKLIIYGNSITGNITISP